MAHDALKIRAALTMMSTYIAWQSSKFLAGSFGENSKLPAGEVLSINPQGVFEDGIEALRQVDLVVGDCIYNTTLTKATSAFKTHFDTGAYDTCLSNMLSAYLGLANHFGDVPMKRIAFCAPGNGHQCILEILSDLGYLSKNNEWFIWTDKAGEAMILGGCWTPDLISCEEWEDLEIENEAKEFALELYGEFFLLANSNPDAAFSMITQKINKGEAFYQIPDSRLVHKIIAILRNERAAVMTFN